MIIIKLENEIKPKGIKRISVLVFFFFCSDKEEIGTYLTQSSCHAGLEESALSSTCLDLGGARFG